ncbi:MAG: pyruvate carboxylase [Tepidisphaerales bacterium]
MRTRTATPPSTVRPIRKLLAANRSEIAIRVFRAATELGLQTVAVYTYEDRFALHRFKADESYLIGPPTGGAPVKGYLDVHAIIETAVKCEADAIHPGYGFLSENAELARACDAAGIVFVGPSADLLETFGDKTAAKKLAQRTGVPTIPGTPDALSDPAEIRKAAREIGFPLIIKASFGGGGRGMRIVLKESELLSKLEEAQREAGAAFGRPEVFLERYIRRAKHIEVQVLGDRHGNLVHLWERDCSVQRRHQKVVEIAPSVKLPLSLRQAICEAAVRLVRAADYYNAGTVEFLVDDDTGEFFFIEVNPRVQVEHTVTEVVTGIDIVKSQILIAQGYRLHEPPLLIPPQERIETRGYCIQCRITTEDPTNHFIPDYGRLTTYRSPAGFGIRLDGGSAYGGATITPYFDSLLVKLSAAGNTFEEAIRRTDRALREFRIRGVKTNIPFLENLINHPTFVAGDATTTFIDTTPELFRFRPRRDRASKLLTYLGDVIVNGRPEVKGKLDPKRVLKTPVPPHVDLAQPPPPGLRDKLRELGPEKYAQWVLRQKRLLITDTTLRDAHQSLLATRLRTYDMLAVADATARLASGLFSLECWGGATFDTAMRFLHEDPWERLRELRRRIPNIPFQMLFRASNAVGYTNYPDNVVRQFVKLAAREGIDIFRIFDSLNWTRALAPAVDAVRSHTDAVCEAAICYTGDILDPRRSKYSLKYYVQMARQLAKMGTHILGIKDMAGLCKPYAARALIKALRDELDIPIHFHTHDTSGIAAASVLQAADAGVTAVDLALAPLSGGTSQPNLNSVVAALAHTPRDVNADDIPPHLRLRLDDLNRLARYWDAVRDLYYPFEEGIRAGTAEVYQHEMPGGQYTNLRQQAKSLGLEDRWDEVAQRYADVNRMLGDIVKVTPSSKVVGDLALFMVTNNLTPDDVLEKAETLHFPKSVVEMMQGHIGYPEGGWPKKLQQAILRSARATAVRGRYGAQLPPADFKAVAAELEKKLHREVSDLDVMSHLMYPAVFADFEKVRRNHDNVSVLPTSAFFYGLRPNEEINVEIEPGKVLVIKFLTVSDPREDGTRVVYFELNGQPREVVVADRSTSPTVHRHAKADPDNAAHIGAPMPGKVSAVNVTKGQTVKAGDRLLSIEAMKMETSIYAPRDARIGDVLVKPGTVVAARDLLVVLEG